MLLITTLRLHRVKPGIEDTERSRAPRRLDRFPEFVGFIWTTRRTTPARMAKLAATARSPCRVVRLRSDREVRDFLTALESQHVAVSLDPEGASYATA